MAISLMKLELIHNFFHSSRVSHIRRRGNCVAYNIAKYERHVNSLVVCMKYAPLQRNNVSVADYG